MSTLSCDIQRRNRLRKAFMGFGGIVLLYIFEVDDQAVIVRRGHKVERKQVRTSVLT